MLCAPCLQNLVNLFTTSLLFLHFRISRTPFLYRIAACISFRPWLLCSLLRDLPFLSQIIRGASYYSHFFLLSCSPFFTVLILSWGFVIYPFIHYWHYVIQDSSLCMEGATTSPDGRDAPGTAPVTGANMVGYLLNEWLDEFFSGVHVGSMKVYVGSTNHNLITSNYAYYYL